MKTEKVTPDGHLVVTSFRFPGEFLGLESLFCARQLADGVAVEDSEVCEFDVERLMSLCARDAALNAWFISRLAQVLQERDAALCSVGFMNCRDRVLRFFVELYDRLGVWEGHPMEYVRMPMSKHDIAAFLHMSPETLSRAIGKLCDGQELRVRGPTFMVVNIQQARLRTSL